MKFGGTSVGDTDCIQRVAGIVEPHHAAGDEVVLVVSACSGITDQIIAMADEVVKSKGEPPVETFLAAMRTRHIQLLAGVAPDYVDEVAGIIEDRLDRLRNIFAAVCTLKELTSGPVTTLYPSGSGSVSIVSVLRQHGIPSIVSTALKPT